MNARLVSVWRGGGCLAKVSEGSQNIAPSLYRQESPMTGVFSQTCMNEILQSHHSAPVSKDLIWSGRLME